MDLAGSFELPDRDGRAPFRPSRTAYPGSRFGPKTRYDLPQRHKAYGNGDEADAILFGGTSLQPLTMELPPSSGTGTPRSTLAAALELAGSAKSASARTPRGAVTPRVFGGTARSVLRAEHPLAAKNLPELPLIDEKNDVHGILVLGGKGSGCTSLVLSLNAAATGSFPSRYDTAAGEKMRSMPSYGQHYELPERDVRLGGGTVKPMRLVLTDAPPCGTTPREEQPLCVHVSPNSTQCYNAIPSWMRIALRGGNYPHYAVLLVIDASAMPLWEDSARCRDLARLLAVLRRNQYTVALAVTKLLQVRTVALRDAAHGVEHRGMPGKDPRSSYEAFTSRYIERVISSIQAKADENDWSLSQGPDCPAFPLMNGTIFDVPTWSTVGEYRKWQEKKGLAEVPNFRYMTSQLNRLLSALSVRSHPE